ncbi:hypothetical protein NXX05_24215 (plasmid) [Bacteroides thetaiotaomicron]|uniref:hypothetical protein n=1 Tax=Bacteroides thetaiotaomicron TaxID=818 RepID=UPI00215D06F6|nr:hypothetical protein [Bacteroides thetaiotaomicron]MCS2687445.1 hypothetical protein [Bacteroides thetaiotaomicron]MCS2850466.1 hypothetical protein [Bacteroides thetaiotaomicron]
MPYRLAGGVGCVHGKGHFRARSPLRGYLGQDESWRHCRVRLPLVGGVLRAVVLSCPLAHRPERLLPEKTAGHRSRPFMGGNHSHP